MSTPTVATVESAAGESCAHLDLRAGGSATVNFTGPPLDRVEVISGPDTTGVVWFTVDGTDPLARGPHSFVLPASCAAVRLPTTGHGISTVRVLAPSTAVISVQAA